MRRDLAEPYCYKKLFKRCQSKALCRLQYFIRLHQGMTHIMFSQVGLEKLDPEFDTLRPLLLLDPLLYPSLCSLCNDKLEPVPARAMGLGRYDLDCISGFEVIPERHDLSVYLGPNTFMSDLRLKAMCN